MGRLPLTYTRPAHVSRDDFRRSQSSMSEKSSLRSGKSGVPSGIPDALSFDRIISGATCPPLTLNNFMSYLLYIEHSAENLQFYLWHQDFARRFKQAPASDLALAPEWTKAMEDDVLIQVQKDATEVSRQKAEDDPSGLFKGTDFEKRRVDVTVAETNPFRTPTVSSDGDRDSFVPPSSPQPSATTTATYRSLANEAFAVAGAKVPFTIQPYREEINRIIITYIVDGAPRQLNLSDRDRRAVLHALSYTTHPSALRIAFQAVDASLRFQNHPNFIRWSICNGNPPRISFARTFGFAGLVGGLIVALLLTLSPVHRGWRAMAAMAWIPGIWAVAASYSGMCICMHLFSRHHHHIRPWDLFVDVEKDPAGRHRKSFESFGSGNSFEDEPWVVKYSQRNLVRKIFDKEAWIEEPALRQIHDTIFIQAMLVGILSSAALTALFVPLPSGNFF